MIKNKFNGEYPNKKFYIFIADTIDYNQLNDFPFIEAWVNTACPRIEEDFRMVNIEKYKGDKGYKKIKLVFLLIFCTSTLLSYLLDLKCSYKAFLGQDSPLD